MENDKTLAIYNPDTEDFTRTYDINENGQPVSFTIHAGEIEKFPKVIAEHLKKHLAKHLTNKRGWAKSNYEDKHNEMLSLIEVKDES